MELKDVIHIPPKRHGDLTEQVRQLREEFPDLYAYLERRDRTLLTALRRVPSREDVETAGVFDFSGHLRKTLSDLSPGISDLASEEKSRDR